MTRSPLGCRLDDWRVTARAWTPAASPARGVILDLDDTLYARETFLQSGFDAVARYVERQYGVAANEARATLRTAHTGESGRELQALCTRYALGDRVLELRDVFRGHLPALRLPATAALMLAQLRAAGWRLVILTNGAPDVQRRKVAALGLEPRVDAVIYADDVAPGGKPAAAAFDAALHRLGVRADRCVCVGDNPHCDIAGARARGIRTVWLPPAGTPPDDTGGADARIGSLRELPQLLDRLVGLVRNDAA